MTKRTVVWLLALIMVGGFFVRLSHVGDHDFHGDEALNAARAMYWFDFLGSPKQTTPVQWFLDRQWWQPLSFHDHPPLGFAFQFLTMRLTGDSVVGLRFPFVIVGTLCIGLIFLLARSLTKNEVAGLVAAFVMAFFPPAIWISRFALFDGLVVMWIILSWWLFVKGMENATYFMWWGLVCGAGLMTKYTFVVMVPFFLVWLFFSKDLFKKKQVWQGAGLGFVLLLPVIIYNGMMFYTRGHFDAAFSSMVGLHPADFELIAGRAGGMHINNLLNTWRLFPLVLGWLFFVGTCVGWVYACARVIGKKARKVDLMIVAYFVFLNLFFVVLQPEARFLTVAIPCMVVAIAVVTVDAWERVAKKFDKKRWLMFGVYGVSLVFFFTAFIYARSFPGSVSYGYNALYKKFDNLFRGSVADFIFAGWEEPQVIIKQKKLEGRPVGFDIENSHKNTIFVVMDSRIEWATKFWLASRYFTYATLPVLDVTDFVKILQPDASPVTFAVDLGFTDFYFLESPDTPITDNDKNIVEALSIIINTFRKDSRFIEEFDEHIPRRDIEGNLIKITHIRMKPGSVASLDKNP